ncbi:MAG TPA: histidine kinase [Mucilaginibacter sp.]|jgi:sensor histidine kinase YesM|nr:histidine kinase [Mucilaginibacter sp.]
MRSITLEKLKMHVIAWAIFIFYERAIAFSQWGRFPNFWAIFAYYLVDIIFFYIHAHIVVPRAYKGTKFLYSRLSLLILAEFVVYILTKYFIFYLFVFIHLPPAPILVKHSLFIAFAVVRLFFILGLSTGYWFALNVLRNRKKIDDLDLSRLQNQLEHEELEKTLLTAENAYLKSQINPHFLLNTLNFLYNSVSKFSDKVADSVMTLSEIMRYALTNAAEDGKVRLEDEIEHVANFIKLNQARFSQRLCIDYSLTGEPGELRIIPLVLITLVENLFKYGDLLNETNPTKIKVNIDSNELLFVTENIKKKNVREKSHGIGIKNITERLKMYHDYELKIEENEQFYRSELIIRL